VRIFMMTDQIPVQRDDIADDELPHGAPPQAGTSIGGPAVIPPVAGDPRQRVRLADMNEDDLNRMEPIPWYRRAWPWLFFIGLPILFVLVTYR